jgi:hypothetical protein
VAQAQRTASDAAAELQSSARQAVDSIKPATSESLSTGGSSKADETAQESMEPLDSPSNGTLDEVCYNSATFVAVPSITDTRCYYMRTH